MAHDAGLGGLYLVASLGESDYRSHVSDGFDAAVHFQFPFGRDATTWVRERLLGRGLGHGPMRYPYADDARRATARTRRPPLSQRLPELGQHAPPRPTGAGGHRVDP